MARSRRGKYIALVWSKVTLVVGGLTEVTLELLDEAGNKTQYFQDYTVSNSPSGLFPKVNAIPKLENDKLVGSIPFKIQLDAGASSGAQIVEYDWDFEISQFKYKYPDLTNLQKFQAFDYENWLPNDLLVKLDRCLMTFGMEGRTPLIDKELFRKFFYINDREKINKGFGKYFIRKFLSTRIKKYNSFSKKEGFTIPIAKWISEKSKILEQLLPKVEILNEFIKKDDIRTMCKNIEYNKRLARPLWNIIFISIWYYTYK